MDTIKNNVWLSKAKELYTITQERLALEKKEHLLALELRDLSNYEAYSFGGLSYFIETRLGSTLRPPPSANPQSPIPNPCDHWLHILAGGVLGSLSIPLGILSAAPRRGGASIRDCR